MLLLYDANSELFIGIFYFIATLNVEYSGRIGNLHILYFLQPILFFLKE